MSFVPNRFLVRVCHPCKYIKKMPDEEGEDLLDLPESCRIDNLAAADGKSNFADVRLAWNDLGFAIQTSVKGKEQAPQGDPNRPRFSDGITIWIDTRDARTSHRASRFCHQFHLLAAGDGADRDEPMVVQTKINRAQMDAPICDPSAIPFRCTAIKGGYRLEAFLPAAVLTGYDPEEHPRLGLFYAVRDVELGEQTLGMGGEFPYSDDPTLWSVLELSK